MAIALNRTKEKSWKLKMVVFMGVAQLDAIVQGLAASLRPDTPAALVPSASTANERRRAS